MIPTTITVEVHYWLGAYDANWRDLIVPEAFAHPAKVSRGLIVRIFDHLLMTGAIKREDIILDPFGGIGTTGIEAASRCLRALGVELEPRFVALARENINLHRHVWRGMNYPVPRMFQGDSRNLRMVLLDGIADCIVSSPPYAEIATGAGGLNTKPPQHPGQQSGRTPTSPSQDTDMRYGTEPGQLAQMLIGDVDAVISSPPYAGSLTQGNTAEGYDHTHYGGGGQLAHSQRYGRSPGQLEAMPTGEVDAVVSSPPYEGSVNDARSGIDWDMVNPNRAGGSPKTAHSQGVTPFTYGTTDGQLGSTEGETFWTAADQIVRECFAVLKPGGYAVWITKAFVRDKQLVDFPGDWRRLCEHAGFTTIEEIRALLVEETTHRHLFDGEVTTRRERKSFFRRLAEKRGSPKIDYEVVWIMRKPCDNLP